MSATPDWEQMFAAATEARKHAYAPYSKFLVGAAVMTVDGSVTTGCNMENASYGLSVCAERHAIARAVQDSSSKPLLLAVAIVTDAKKPTPPCGVCRQVMVEFGSPSVEVRTRNLKGAEESYTLGELLPHAFGPESL